MANLYDFTVDDIDGQPVKLDRYKGKVLLDRQHREQVRLHAAVQGPRGAVRKYTRPGPRSARLSLQPVRRAGARQRAGDRDVLRDELRRDVSDVREGRRQRRRAPRRSTATSSSAKPGLLGTEAIKWNFTKFLVDRDGNVVARYAPNDTPESIAARHREGAVMTRRRRALRALVALAASAARRVAPARARASRRRRRRCASRFRSPRPASIRRRPATSIRTTSIARSSIRSIATTTSRARTSSCPNTAAGMPEISDDGKTWTIHVRQGIYFADDPVFKGKRRELTAADYVYAIKRILDPKMRSNSLQMVDGRFVGADARRREGEGDRASSTTTRRSRACRRSTATRCASSSTSPTTSCCRT